LRWPRELTAYDWDWANAEKEVKRASDLNPNYPTAHSQYFSTPGAMRPSTQRIANLRSATHHNFMGKWSDGVAVKEIFVTSLSSGGG